MSDRKKYFISYTRVTSLEQLTELRLFAESFNHFITDGDLCAPIIMVKCDEELIGYVIIVNRTIAFPAWHPQKTTPHIIKLAISELNAWAKIEAAFNKSEICGWVARSDDSPFTDEVMEKLNLAPTNMKLFRVKGKQNG